MLGVTKYLTQEHLADILRMMISKYLVSVSMVNHISDSHMTLKFSPEP